MLRITNDILEALLSPDPNRRQPAERELQCYSVDDRCTAYLQALLTITTTTTTTNAPYTQFIAVLMRRDVLICTNLQLLQSFLPQLVHIFQGHRRQTAISDVIAEVCSNLSVLANREISQGAMNFVWQARGANSPFLDEAAVRLLLALAERTPKSFSETFLPVLPTIFAQALNQQGSLDDSMVGLLVQLVMQAAVACTATLPGPLLPTPNKDITLDPNSQAAQLGTYCWLPLCSRVRQPDATVLQAVLHAAELNPQVLIGTTQLATSTFHFCHSCLPHADVQLQAIHVVAALATVMKRSIANLMEPYIQTCLHIMVEDMDDEEWAAEPATLWEDEYNDTDAAYAQENLESILHSTLALSTALPLVENWMNQHPRVGLAALQCCWSAAPKAMNAHAAVALQAALQACHDASPRVQYQALSLLGLLCETTKLESSSKAVLQVCGTLVQSKCSKVATLACRVLVSYVRYDADLVDETRPLVPYLSELLSTLVAGPLSSSAGSSVAVLVRAIGAVACLAEAAGQDFVGFYSHVMPGLLQLVSLQGSSYELSYLRGAALEAATIVGRSIGEDNKGLFVPDAEQIMQLALKILSQPLLDGDVVSGIPLDQLLAACARIASVMREAYAPYAGVVLPHLLARATDPSDVEVSEGDQVGLDASKQNELDVDGDMGTQSMTVAIPGRGLTKVTINTSKIQDKSVAARSIYEHAVALGAEFGPYAQTCLDAFLLLVQFKYSSELRATSAQTLAAIFETACGFGESAGMYLPAQYLPLVAKAIAKQIVEEDELDMEVLYALSDGLSDIFCSVYGRLQEHGDTLLAGYSIDDSNSVVQFCMKAIVACLHRRTTTADQLASANQSGASEDEVYELESSLHSEQELLTPLVDSVGYNLKFFREDFISIFESQVAPVMKAFLMPGNDIRARWSATCLYDDCVEFCGTTAAAKYASDLVVGAVSGLQDSSNGMDSDLKQTSIYGVSQICRYAPTHLLVPYADQIVPELLALVRGDKNETEQPAIFENAVSALASLVLFSGAPFVHNKYVSFDQVLNIFLRNLPLLEDFDESAFCNAGLCDLVEKGSVPLTAYCNELVRIIGETLAHVDDNDDLASSETCLRFAGILFKMQNELPGETIQRSFDSLSLEGQAAVQKAIGMYASRFSNVVSP